MISKKFSLVFCFVFLISFASAQYYGDFRPSEFLQNEWVIFGGVFLIIFSIIYIALNNAFAPKEKGVAPIESLLGIAKKPAAKHYRGAIVVISLVIAFFSASAFVQRGWIDNYFGDFVGGWILLLCLFVVVLLSVPFYKALKSNLGGGVAIAICFLVIWGILKFFVEPSDLIIYGNLPTEFFEFYDFVTSVWMLVVAGGLGILFAIIKNSTR